MKDEEGEWTRLQNEELRSLYRSPNIARMIKCKSLRLGDQVASLAKDKGAFKIVIGIRTGNMPLGRPMCKWEDNMRMDLNEIGVNMRN